MLSYLCFALVFVAACDARSTKPVNRSAICGRSSGYYKVDGSCDSYVECNGYIAHEKTCPDGLHFNLKAEWPTYPCGYPMEVPCIGRGSTRPAIPTAGCPHQYGFFPAPNAYPNNCGEYRMCVAGRVYNQSCPFGLAFNPASSRCDWPDNVPSCNAQDYLRFTCPPPTLDAYGNAESQVTNHRHVGSCHYFFSCEKGHARLLSCDPGLSFSPAQGRCIDSELVQCDIGTGLNMFGILSS